MKSKEEQKPKRRCRPRKGLRVRGQRCDPEVRKAVIRFATWLRREYGFPVRVPVYLSPRLTIKTITGAIVTASFFAPWDKCVEPFIRIATGDYHALKRERGRDNALASILCSLCHEVIHYNQWLSNKALKEDGIERKARRILRRYAESTPHP